MCFGKYFCCVFRRERDGGILCGVVGIVWGYKSLFVDVVWGGEGVSVDECVWDILGAECMFEVGLPFSVEF